MKRNSNMGPSNMTGMTALAALTLSSLMTACVAEEQPSATSAKASIADKILDALVETNGVPGMAGAVTQDGALIWSGASGLSNVDRKTPVNGDTIFRLASVSKLIAATAAAQLYETGALDIDAPLQDFIPYMPEQWPAMTARQLAAHTSGIPHYQAVDETRGNIRYSSVEDAVGVFSDRSLLFAPGDAYNYSSYGYTLLSAAVEEAAGVPYLDYIKANVVKDLAIGPDALAFGDPNASEVYAFADQTVVPAEPHNYSYSWGGAGMSATAPALAMFGARVMSGDIVSPQTLDIMLEPSRLNNGDIVSVGNYSVGFGWRLSRDSDGAFYAHHAGIAIGARSALAIYPEEKISATVLSNALWTAAIEQTALTLALPFRVEEKEGAPCPDDAQRYSGDFAGDAVAGSVRFAVEDGVCVGTIEVDNAFGAWLNGFPQKDVAELKIISVTPDGGLSRAALVTAIGAFELRRQEDGKLSARIGNTRELTLFLSQ